jgi:3-oxoacyl-[acyl-carrier-protein] synthase II
MKRRAVITGAGIVGPQALDAHQFWELVREGRSAIQTIRRFDAAPTGCSIGGEVPPFALGFIPPKFKPKRHSRHTHLLLKAADQLRELLPPDGAFNLRVGLATSDISMIAESGVRRAQAGFENVCPMVISQSPPHAAVGMLSMFLECRGEVQTVSTACAAGMDAIGLAAREIVSGDAEVVVAGGVDGPLDPSPLAEFVRSGLASRRSRFPDRSSRPFDCFADTGVLSEAAGLLMLEEAEHALSVAHEPLCEVIGYGNFPDTDPAVPGGGYAESMRRAFRSAAISPADIDAIFAWGPGHPVLDRAEATALEEIFGERLGEIPTTSIKGVIGNPLAGAGPLQVAAAAFALVEGLVPPTANHDVPIPGLKMDMVTGCSLYSQPERVLLNAHGVGGANCTLILQRWSN